MVMATKGAETSDPEIRSVSPCRERGAASRSADANWLDAEPGTST